MGKRIHYVEQHRTIVPGIEMTTKVTNHPFPRHSHDQLAIGVIGSGVQRSWTAVGTVYASPGDVITANPGEIHDGVPVAGKTSSWRIIYLDPQVVYRAIEEETIGTIEIARPVIRDHFLAATLTRLFECLADSNSDRLAIEENLISCLIHFLQRYGTSRRFSHGSSPRIAKAVEHLNAHPERSVSLAEMAAIVGASRFQVLRAFVRELGITPHAYLIQRRVLLARQLLASGQPPAEAAIGAGFADQSHMTRAFVRQMGITPSRYQAAVA